MPFAKSCIGEFEVATCKVTGACPAVALCEGGKTLPFTDRSEGTLIILRSFEIASRYYIFPSLPEQESFSTEK